MKTIRIDFSAPEVSFPDGKIIGCEGIHNAVTLTAALPESMICEQITSYTMLFCNGEGELVYSDELLPDANEVSCVLWEQLFCGNELSVQVLGIGFEGNEVTVIDKTPIVTLEVMRSIDGERVSTQPDSHGILAQLTMVREKIAMIEILGSVNGVALKKSEINSRGELLLTYSNGKTYNLGVVKGEKGADGLDGKDGADGRDGKDGADGTPATHSWNGSVLTVTSASGTSSADLRGAKGEKGDTGAKGEKGDTGPDGYTPVKGIDYWSSADKAEMDAHNVAVISTELAKRAQLKPEFANAIGECTDTSKLYVLPDGYIYAYMSSVVFPEITIEEKSSGFWELKNGSMQWADASGYSAKRTNIIPVTPGDTLEYTGMAMWNVQSVVWYDSSGTIVATEKYSENESTYTTVAVTAPTNAVSVQFYSFRASSNVANVMLEVRWLSCATSASVQWSNTGLNFVANNLEVTARNPLKDKRIIYLGDSICAGTYSGGGYARLISELTDSHYVNNGVDGSRLRTRLNTTDNFNSIVDNVLTMPANGDLYCIEGGINDWWSYGVLGTYDKMDFTSELDTTTVCGALETIFRFILGSPTFASKPVCFVITHKIQRTAYVQNENGDTFEDYHDAMVGICNKYSIPYYDAFLESGLNGWNEFQSTAFLTGNENGTPDGCHPNEEGYRRYYVPQLIALFEKIMPRGDA